MPRPVAAETPECSGTLTEDLGPQSRADTVLLLVSAFPMKPRSQFLELALGADCHAPFLPLIKRVHELGKGTLSTPMTLPS